MSVLIKNMEMPERCGQCFSRVGNCKQRIYMERRPKGCPLVEVKEPHGRLIDADVLKQSAHLDGQLKTYIDTWIDSHATVIEAEGKEVTE